LKNNTGQVTTPIHLLLSPSTTEGTLNNIDFSHVGNVISKDTNAFKKIQTVSKLANNALVTDTADNNALFRRINNLYINNSSLDNNSYYYGTPRQHNLTSSSSLLPSNSALMDKKSFNKFFEYTSNNNKLTSSQYTTLLQNKTPLYNSTSRPTELDNQTSESFNINSKLDNMFALEHTNYSTFGKKTSIENKLRSHSLNTLTDKQNSVNPLKSIDTTKKFSYKNDEQSSHFDELIASTQTNFFS
jgi:hypothetical protein